MADGEGDLQLMNAQSIKKPFQIYHRIVVSGLFQFLGVMFIGYMIWSDNVAEMLGEFRPVTDELTVLSVEQVEYLDDLGNPQIGTLIKGKAVKHRDCDYKRIIGTVEDHGIVAPVDIVTLDESQARKTGMMEFTEGFLFKIEPYRLGQVSADVAHKCAGVLHISDFFEGEDLAPSRYEFDE